MRRKFLSVVLCVCMMLTMAPFAFAAEGDAVAKIGDTPYETLQAAITAANDSDTIILQQNVTIPSVLSIDKNITIDLNQQTVTGSGSRIFETSGEVTLKNGTIIAADRGSAIRSHNKLSLENVSITGAAKTSSLLYVNNGSNVTIDKNSTLSATDTTEDAPYPAIFIGIDNGLADQSQELHIYGKVSTAKAPSIQGNGTDRSVSHIYIYEGAIVESNKVAMYLPQPCDVNITGGIVKGYCAIGIKSGTLNISGGTVQGIANDNVIGDEYSNTNGISYDGSAILIDSYIGYAGQVQINISDNAKVESLHSTAIREIGNDASQTNMMALNISGGQIIGASDSASVLVRDVTKSTVSLTGGTFSSNVTKYCAKNYYADKNEDNTYTVKSLKDIATAQIGDTYYESLTDAYAALPRGNGVAPSEPTTITLLADCAGGGIGSDGDNYMNYVIDFNGHTYTVGAPAVGSTGTVSQGIRVLKNSTAKFMNGTLKAANYNKLVQVVHTYGDVTFQDFTVDASEDAYAWAAVEPDAGTLKVLGNSSILARKGQYGLYTAFWHTSLYDGTIVDVDTTGKITGKLAYEFDEDYSEPNKATENKGFLNIKNGYFDVISIEEIWSDVDDRVNRSIGGISISGGYFTVDPTDYVADSYTAVETTEPGYNYEVVQAKTEKADVATAKPDVTKPDGLNGADLAAATAVSSALVNSTNTVVGDGLNAAANTVANKNTVTTTEGKKALEDKKITTGTENTRIVIQTYMDIDITAVNTTNNTLTLDITPMYRTVATTTFDDNAIKLTGENVTGANAVLVGPAGKLTINKPVTVSIPLPTSFTITNNTAYVQHKGYEYTATVVGNVATFVNPHGFSSFTITANQTAVAEVNGTNYINFQDAVDAVENGGTITALKDIDSTVSGNKSFKVSENGKTVKLTAASGYNLTNSGDTYTVSHQSSGGPGSSGGSISAPTTYNVNVNAATNGAVAADKKTASKGTTVTVTASPSKGYVVDAVKVVDKDGKDVAVTEKDGKYVFTMPASAVTVTGSFKAETPAPVALPFTDVKSGNWFYDAVKYAYAQGLMTGTSATTFAPNGTMNRAMIVTVLYRLEKSPAVTGASKFTDVPAGQWYSDAVAWAAANKIVNGYDETTFGPMNAVTREQMAAILFRYEQVKGLENVTLEENLNRFPDQNKISAYAIPALQWAVGQKIINGNADGTLDPTGTATRAQVAQIFTNLLNK